MGERRGLLRYVGNQTLYYLYISMILLYLFHYSLYYFSIQEMRLLSIQIQKGKPAMKLAIRIFALSLVVVAAAAAATTSKTAPALPSHQSATVSMPGPPMCGPYMACAVEPTGK